VNQPESEADYSPPSNAQVKNAWSYTSTPPLSIHGMERIKEYVFMA